ncbi:MAG: hypothetical protein ACNI3H_14050 [Halarcobacter ebronensis]
MFKAQAIDDVAGDTLAAVNSKALGLSVTRESASKVAASISGRF